MASGTADTPTGTAIAPSDEAYAGWRAAVAKVLAKARGVDPAALGDEPERLLAATTYDGLTIAPLYTGRDELPELPLPGRAPYVRGTRASRLGWQVCVRHGHTDDPPAAVNEALLDELTNGATALWLTVGGSRPVADLAPMLAGVHLDLVPLVLDAGAGTTAAAQQLLGLAETVDQPAQLDLCLGADPHSLLLGGGSSSGVEQAVALARAADDRVLVVQGASVRALMVDATVLHDAGASDAEEVGAAIASGVAYVRALVAGGLSARSALGHIDFRLAATDDQFATIAKLRAGRRLWARVADVLGAPDAGGMRQHAVTSAVMMAQRDPWVNLLRTTVAAFAAGAGGAQLVTVRPFDAAIPGGAPDATDGFSRRLARNISLLLLEESHVGRVRDVAGGSWYVESLTADLAAAGWEWFQQLEAAGGFAAAVESGLLAERISATRACRDDDIAHRLVPLTGVSEFPDLGEAPLPPATDDVAPGAAGAFLARRYPQPYERLRDRSDAHLASTGARPRVFLATIGTTAAFTPRATFTANLLAAGGVEALGAGERADPAAFAAAFRGSGAGVACLCGTDDGYREHGAAVVAALRDAGATEVLAAGPEAAFSGAVRPDGCLTTGIDAVAVLTGLLDRMGVA